MRQAVGQVPVSHKTSRFMWDRRLSHLSVSHKTSGNKWDKRLSHTPVPLACRTYFGETGKWDRCLSHIFWWDRQVGQVPVSHKTNRFMWDRCLSHLFWASVLLDFSGVLMIDFHFSTQTNYFNKSHCFVNEK